MTAQDDKISFLPDQSIISQMCVYRKIHAFCLLEFVSEKVFLSVNDVVCSGLTSGPLKVNVTFENLCSITAFFFSQEEIN